MSLHLDCMKCGKYLGGVSLVDGLSEEKQKEMYDMFFKQPNCPEEECPYKNGI